MLTIAQAEGRPDSDLRSSVFVTLPPGPTSSALVQTLRFMFRPLPFMRECERRYGEAFTIRLVGFGGPAVLVSHPDAIKALYSQPAHGVPPGRNLLLEPVLGPHSIFLLDGDEHLARRRLMLPPFHGERMRSHEPIVRELVNAEIDSWPLDEEFSLHPRMQAVTLEIILRVVFGMSDSESARRDRLRASVVEILEAGLSPAMQLLGLLSGRLGRGVGPWRRFEARVRQADEEVYAAIDACRKDPNLEQRDDILSALVQARFEDGEGMTDSDVRDQLMTLLFAGHETTATGLAWTFDLVLGNPAVLRRLRESLLEGEDEYLQATIAEALRMRPLVPQTGRKLAKELEVNGFNLPVGTDITPAIWLTHTRADVYPEPFAFRPERFLEDPPETYAWIPFGGGIRRCLGATFAEFEMRIALREVLTRCELQKADPQPERVARRGPTLSPRKGTPVLMTKRGAPRGHDLAAA